MRPDAAAERLAELDATLAAGILMKLDARKAGVILNEMERKAAAMLTGIMASAARKERTRHDPRVVFASSRQRSFRAAAPALQGDRPGAGAVAGRRRASIRRKHRPAEYAEYPSPPVKRFSLWNDRQSRLFTDPRALSPGDILTVRIRINDRAKFKNESERSRTASRSLGRRRSTTNGTA